MNKTYRTRIASCNKIVIKYIIRAFTDFNYTPEMKYYRAISVDYANYGNIMIPFFNERLIVLNLLQEY